MAELHPDCLVLWDEELHTESLCDVVRRIKLQLEAAGVSCHPQHLPGANRLQSDVTAIADSGAVILVITNNPSPYYQQVVGLCVNAKYQTDKPIIPVFSGVTQDEAKRLLEMPAYMPFENTEHDLYEEPGSMERVISCIKEPAICDILKDTYPGGLAGSILPFPSAKVYVAPRCHAKRRIGGKISEDSELQKRADFVDILEHANPGDTIMVHAAAGFGKSSLLCNAAIQWQKGDLSSYKYLYLLTVRKITNHTEVLERVITRDLKLLPERYESKVRRSLKFCAKQSLILVDGYDELNDDVKEYSSLNELLSRRNEKSGRDFLKDAVVVVSTRPNCTDHIIQKTRGQVIDLPLNKLNDGDVKSYVHQMYPQNEDKASLILKALHDIPAPGDTLHVPLFLAMLCGLCHHDLEKSGNLDALSKLRTSSSILDKFWTLLLEVKHNKKSGVLSKKERATGRCVKELAKLCFDSLERGVYIFSDSLLKRYMLSLDELTELGPIDVTTTGDNAGASFIHASLQEYCAGMHIAENESALRKVLDEWRGGTEPTALFTRYKNALIYSVGINNNVLSTVTVPPKYLRLTTVGPPPRKNIMFMDMMEKTRHCNIIDLRVESELMHECNDRDRRLEFLDRVKASPVTEGRHSRVYDYMRDINRSAYDTLVSDLGHSGCLEIVKRVYTERDPHNPDLIVLPEEMIPVDGDFRQMNFADPLLLHVLSHISLSDVTHLTLYNVSPVILKHVKTNKLGHSSVKHLTLSWGELRVDQLASLVSLVSPPDRIQGVIVYAAVTTEAEPPDVHPVSVRKLSMRRDVNMSVMEEMTHRMKIDSLLLWGPQLLGDADRTYTLKNVKKLVIRDYFEEFHLSMLEQLVAPSLIEMCLPPRAAKMKTRLQTLFPNVNVSYESENKF